MKVRIFYYSETGNTKKVAEFFKDILEARGIFTKIERIVALNEAKSFFKKAVRSFFKKKTQIYPIDFSIEEEIVIIGCPVWAFTFPPAVRTFFEDLPKLQDKKIILFVTYGSGLGKDKCLNEMEKFLEKKGAYFIRKISFQEKEIKEKRGLITKLEKLIKSL